MEYHEIRKKHFSDNWLAWVVLHHFLPVSLLRELSSSMIESMSEGSLSLADLFDENFSVNSGVADAWMIRPRPVDDSLGMYLQARIRSFVWKNDERVLFDTGANLASGLISPYLVEAAVDLGKSDLSLSVEAFNHSLQNCQDSVKVILSIINEAKIKLDLGDSQEFLGHITDILQSVEMPLSGAIVKHLGDLLADRDDWEKADALYQKALCLFSSDGDAAWAELYSSILAITVQSFASSRRILLGNNAAAEVYDTSPEKWGSMNSVLFSANSSHESLSVHSGFGKEWPGDYRTSVLLSPLFMDAHNLDAPLLNWLDLRFDDAHKKFWAVLRRQIALGSGGESRSTKIFYAQSIIDHLKSVFEKQRNIYSFLMAVRLVIESENAESAAKIEWDEKTIGFYVDERCVELIVRHAEAYEGVQFQRQSVAVELLSSWAVHIPTEKHTVAEKILSYLSELAVKNLASIEASKDVGVKSMKALKEIAKRRKELRHVAPHAISRAVVTHLSGDGWWTGAATAAETAMLYADVFSEPDLKDVTEAALRLLEKILPSANLWVVVRPVQELLMTPCLRGLIGTDTELEKRVLTQILRFGLEQEDEQANMMHYLRLFDENLLGEHELGISLANAIGKVKERAKNIGSSNVLENIQALLSASTFSGLSGVEAALDGISKALMSAGDKHQCIVLPYAYSPLLMLSIEHERIANSIGLSDEEFKAFLRPLLELTMRVWSVAKEKLTPFVPFSIPQSNTPNSVAVHNWVFTSMQFAQLLGEESAMQNAIAEAAAAQPAIAAPVERARAIRALSDVEYKVDLSKIRSESRDVFYLNMGRRISIMSGSENDSSPELCKLLLDMCFLYGPHDLDLSVFVVAAQLGLVVDDGYSYYKRYMERLEGDKDRRLNFIPLLQRIAQK